MSLAVEAIERINDLGSSDSFWEALDYDTAAYKQVDHEVVDQRRWYTVERYVFRCQDGTYFGVRQDEPATEMQEGQDFNAGAFLVEPREVTVTKYVKVESGV